MKQEIKIGVNESNQRLDKFLRKLFKDTELSLIFKDIRKGNIRVNGKKEKVDYKLKENDIIRIFGYHYNLEGRKDKLISDINSYNDYVKPRICYEDDNVLVVIKDVGSIIHSNGEEGLRDLTKDVRVYLNKKGEYDINNNLVFSPSSINRLDRNTYGLVIFGKNNKSLNELNTIMRERKISKHYNALIHGKIKEGLYTAYIKKDSKSNKSIVSNKKDPSSKKIQMEVKVLDTNGVVSLIDINLLTGRSHQIRSHLDFLGNSIVGDHKYGKNGEMDNYFYNKYGVNNQLLFAYKIIFKDINEDFSISYLNNKVIVSPLPHEFKRIVKQEFKIRVKNLNVRSV